LKGKKYEWAHVHDEPRVVLVFNFLCFLFTPLGTHAHLGKQSFSFLKRFL